MQETDFFTWRRELLHLFQEMTSATEVYKELQRQTQQLEFDYFSLCVRHPVPFTRPKLSLQTTYPEAWKSHYVAENFFAIDPVLKTLFRDICRGAIAYLWMLSLYGTAPAITVCAEALPNV